MGIDVSKIAFAMHASFYDSPASALKTWNNESRHYHERYERMAKAAYLEIAAQCGFKAQGD